MTTAVRSSVKNELTEHKATTRHVPAPGDRRFTISHNNQVEPNFHSETYQIEAKASFKKRMQYNPREAAKVQKNRPNLDNVQSEYS